MSKPFKTTAWCGIRLVKLLDEPRCVTCSDLAVYTGRDKLPYCSPSCEETNLELCKADEGYDREMEA